MNKKDEFERALKEDKKYFKSQVKKEIERLAGVRTRARVKGCYHCDIWNLTDKFIKEVLSK